MKVLVTGAYGFVGRHLVSELQQAGHEVVPHDMVVGNLTDPAHMSEFVAAHRPEGCIHLAGVAFVPKAWIDPANVFDVNVGGTLNLLEAIRAHAPACRFVYISSAQVYGGGLRDRPIRETDSMEPDNLYGVTKMSADLSTLLYARRYGMATMSARPCNHIGPGQSADFVVPSFASQIRAIRAGTREPLMMVGNLESQREFADVRDVARAYRMILEKGTAGRGYNIATGRFVKVRFLLETLAGLAGVTPRIEVDPALYRQTDTQPALDTTAITTDTGWVHQITLEDSLRDILAALP